MLIEDTNEEKPEHDKPVIFTRNLDPLQSHLVSEEVNIKCEIIDEKVEENTLMAEKNRLTKDLVGISKKRGRRNIKLSNKKTKNPLKNDSTLIKEENISPDEIIMSKKNVRRKKKDKSSIKEDNNSSDEIMMSRKNIEHKKGKKLLTKDKSLIKNLTDNVVVPKKRPGRKPAISLLSEEQKEAHKIFCETCNKTYPNQLEFILHSIIHSEDNTYTCSICNKRITTEFKARCHFKWHDKTLHKCEICHRAFKVKSYAEEHKYSHTGERRFQCEICGSKFIFTKSLANHRRKVHYEDVTGQPFDIYDCTICKKHHTSRSGLEEHKLSKHNENGVELKCVCDICGQRVKNRMCLYVHKKKHNKPYQCTTCNKKFYDSTTLKIHHRLHTGEKPYKCQFCEMTFISPRARTMHEVKHDSEYNANRPNQCTLCKIGFVTEKALKVHTTIYHKNVSS